uniref:Enhancer of polycomb-like protein n=1 Tax=Caenorhabditis japonica TaxID=281687 RepID=A0A8R1DMS5_CAEJA
MATTSKAFRARAFDSNRSMTVFWGNELPDLAECSVGNRAVTQMPSGMEKEEEMESHLQDAILAQQASTSGVQVNHVIPTPRVNQVEEKRYNATYHNRNKMQRTKYIKVHAWQALERDEPEYDYDTEDEAWLAEHTHVDPRVLEKIFDTVECHSSETQIASEDSVINIHKSLDSSIVYEVYEYWLSKRTSAATTSGCVGVGGLIPRVRTECRKDGQGAVNPYVAFRRRAEKMQTRKNRKNDEDSYEKILKLVHDMSKAQQLFDMTARREKQKLALIDMESEILMKRMEMSDFGTTSAFNEFTEKMRQASESTKPFSEINGSVQEEAKKRKKVRRKIADKDLVSKAWLKRNAESWNRPPSLFGQIGPPGVSVSTKPVRESMADGRYSFKRRRGCMYRAALTVYPVPPPPSSGLVAPSQSSTSVTSTAASASASTNSFKPSDAPVPAHMKFYNTFLPDSSGQLRSIGFARRRVGRGGRVLFDRMPRQHENEEKISTDPWAEYCVTDSSKTFRARQSSLGTEEESDELDPKALYFSRSNRVNFNDDETEREWTSRYSDSWKIEGDEETIESELFSFRDEKLIFFVVEFNSAEKEVALESTSNENDDSEVERMDVDGQEDEAQITDNSKVERAINGNGNEKHDKNEDEEEEEDMDVDVDASAAVMERRIRHMNGGKMKPLQEHSPSLSGNGRADRAEPTPVPAKMCGTVSDSDEWREPSGSPSESNSSTEWGGYTQEHVSVVLKAKLMNADDEEPSPARARDHSIKDSMSTVTMLDRKKYILPSTIGM